MPPSAPSASESLCELRGVDIASPRVPTAALLQDVEWRLAAGEKWLLASPSGAGKSALLLTAAGIQRPLRGEVRLFGQGLTGLREQELLALRRQVGLVFEGGGRLFPDLTLAQNIALPLAYHESCTWSEAWPRVAPFLEWLELSSLAGQMPAQLPRLWGARAGLARALVLQPRLLLLDHPWRGADSQERDWWQRKLEELPQQAPSVAAVVIALDEPIPWLHDTARLAVAYQRRLHTFAQPEDARAWLAEHHLLATSRESG